mgnify:CR=1 FL=1
MKPSSQFLHIAGVGQEIIRTRIQRFNTIPHASPFAEHQGGKATPQSGQLGDQGYTGGIGQHPVEDHGVEIIPHAGRNRRLAMKDNGYNMSHGIQSPPQIACDQ